MLGMNVPEVMTPAFVARALGAAEARGWCPDSRDGDFVLVFTGSHFQLPVEFQELEALMVFLKREEGAPQCIDVIHRLDLMNIAWRQAKAALEDGNQVLALWWAEKGIRVAEKDPVCMGPGMNMRVWFIREYGHQDDHPVLDTRVLVNRFFEDLPWSPKEAVQAAQSAKERQEQNLPPVQESNVVQRHIWMALRRLKRIKGHLPSNEWDKLQPWFDVYRDLSAPLSASCSSGRQ
ncbi:hypothetical protein [Deinococcus hopiensis]|uniref:hypothetical protein n=1 Tax=Deinococcus hopiensis TaxID=309885 RepID=UPI00111C8C92|nr:hypothetical protein [Deinococcus hopiensis]